GLAQRPGEPMLWGDWPVTPVTNRWVFEYQLLGNPQNEYEDLPSNLQLYPFDYGRNRWTDDFKMFDIGQESPYPVTHGRGRYLNADQPGVTIWEAQGPQTGQPPSQDDIYGFRYDPGASGEPVRGSCYFPHSDAFPTLLETTNDALFPGEQECYVGNYCDEATCCDAVGAIIARCCTDSLEPWDPLCIQVALDLYLADRGTDGAFFYNYTCHGPTPFQNPQYPDVAEFAPTYVTMPMIPNPNPIPDAILGANQYDPDPRNIALNPYVEVVLPTYIDPAYELDTSCFVFDVTAANSFQPTNGRGQGATGLPNFKVPPTDNEFDTYSSTRDFTGRLFQFIPRCQGIYSSAGQCNVPGSKSGRSSWAAVAEDESILIGCQDFDCCMRVIATMLQEKDIDDPEEAYSDFEWINFGHMGVPVDWDHPPLSGQWTTYMAMKARELCYPAVEQVDLDPDTGDPNNAPNFSSLQINAMAEVHQMEYDGADTREWMVGPATDPDDGSITTGMTDISSGQSSLRQLIWAPMSWSDPELDDGTTCLPPHQNIYEMCPEPYYGGGGMAMWPDINFESLDPLSPVQEAFTSFSSAIRYLQELSGLDPPDPPLELSAYGNGIKIAVLAESAWLQEYTLFGQPQGGIHADLTEVKIEEVEDEIGDVSEVRLDFSDPRATARGTAVLGVIAATNNGFGVTGMSHEAETTFFPTRSGVGGSSINSINRLEDAFLAALGYLGPGDVMVLAYEPDGGSILFDLASESLLELAAAQQGITI
ncbi:MAG: hypothetical protein QF471_00275, partial [Phycisphaerales bacterium]|nr:hypothetical protein [Phycisphaerales bacterium]